MDFSDWKSSAVRLLNQLKAIDFGYDLGANVVRDPDSGTAFLNDSNLSAEPVAQLRSLYNACDGFSWPDVHNGYYLKPRKGIGHTKDEYDPVRVIGSTRYDIVVIGSSGTGSLFAMESNGKILLLPPGKIEKYTYFDTSGKIQVVATGLSDFLGLLLADLRAFVEDTPGHTYVS